MTRVKTNSVYMEENPAQFEKYLTYTEKCLAKVEAYLTQTEKLGTAVVLPHAHRVLSHFLSNPGLAHLQKHAPFGMH